MSDIVTSMELITPEIAKVYVEKNIKNNRPLHAKVISKYARDMKNGKFITTHQGIAFDENGNLIDGHHRLVSVILSGASINSLVTRGVPSVAMAYIDRGTSRTVRDSLVVSNTGSTISDRVLKHSSVPAVLRQLVVCSYKEMSLSVSEITELFNLFKTQMVELFSLNNAKHNGANRCQILSAAVAAMYCGVSVEDIDKFFRVFKKSDIVDCAGKNVAAVLDWRRQIDDAKYHGSRMPGDMVYMGTQNAIYNFVNNTGVKRLSIPKYQRYDVTNVVSSIFSNT